MCVRRKGTDFWNLNFVKFLDRHHHHHHHISVMELGNLLTRSVSRIQKSLQSSAMIPSASWEIMFHYPG
jgi:hypothetical protein